MYSEEDMDIKFQNGDPKYLQLYNIIKNKILNGEISYGDKLPTIRDLSKSLDINRVTVVSAYNLLESERYVKKRVGSGTFVCMDISATTNKKSVCKKNFYRLDNANPSLNMFPIDEFRMAINLAMDREGAEIFSYDENHGIEELKEEMVFYLGKNSIHTKTDNLIIISGAQQGIDIASKTLINYSDTVFVEEPTYSGALNILKSRGARIVSIPMLDDGIDIGILKMKLEKLKPKVVYVMTTYQNPTGISYTEKKKKKLLELAEEYDFYIIEDDFISDLRFMGDRQLTLKTYDKNDRVIYIKSFSKILMPGLRVGVMCIPEQLVDMFVLSKVNSDISTSTLIQKSLYYYMNKFDWGNHISNIEKIYQQKYIEVRNYIYDHLGYNFEIRQNFGGINFFIGLKRGYLSRDFCEFMKSKGVLLLPGNNFYNDKIDSRFFRLNIVSEEVSRLKEAIDIIENSIEEYYEKYRI